MDQDLQETVDKVKNNINKAAILLNQPGQTMVTLYEIARSLSISSETLDALSRTQQMRDRRKTTQK